MGFSLKSSVTVAEVQIGPADLIVLPAGTPIEDIPKEQLAQLAPDHFMDDDSAEVPPDWRDAEAQAADAEAMQRREDFLQLRATERAEAQAARDKEGGE